MMAASSRQKPNVALPYRSDDGQRSWQAPSFMDRPADRLAFCKFQKNLGEQWVQSQPSYNDIGKAIDVISGRTDIISTETRSGINTARLKRDAREVIGTLANIRPFWGYSSDASFYDQSAAMMNKAARALYLESFFDRSLKGALQYALVTGDGYIWPKYSRSLYGRGPGRLKFDYLGALDVLPVQMPRDNDLQEAYIVTICDFVPVAKAHSMFPLFQDKLKPIARRRYKGTSTTGQRMSLAEKFKFGSRRDSFMELYCEINYQYILDQTINVTGAELNMGQEGTSWFYKVPYVGQEISLREPLSGEIYKRHALSEDCYVYPYRRVMIFNEDALMYDGPAWDWHRYVPVFRFSLDRWAHEGSGQVLLRDGYEYQNAINELERCAQTVAKARLRPGLTYDLGSGGSVNQTTAEGMDPFAPDLRVGIDSSGGSDNPAFNTILPKHLHDVPAWFFTLMDHYNQGMDYQLGLKEIMALAKIRANVASADIDKLADTASGPVVQDISRDMEMPLAQIGDAVKYLILQYYTTKRIMQYVGEDGVTPETFDYDPDSLVPSHMPFEKRKFEAAEPSGTPKIDRARHFAENLRFSITPYSVHEITQMKNKLAYIQLKKVGVWISNQTIAGIFNIPNYGHIGGNTEIEKFWLEHQFEMEKMAELKQVMEGLGLGTPGGGGKGGKGGKEPVGRPNVNTAPAQIKNKEGGARSTIATSQ
jgi:hypothetical protein